MNPEQLQQIQPNQVDGTTLGLNMDGMMQQLESVILYGTIASVAILIPFLILYVLSSRRKSKAYKAIIDMQKTLHEMNERDKARDNHAAPGATQSIAPTQVNGPIARSVPVQIAESEVATHTTPSSEQPRF